MRPSLEVWPTKAKEAPSLHELRLAPLDTNPVFQSLGAKSLVFLRKYLALPAHCHLRIENTNVLPEITIFPIPKLYHDF